MLVLCTHSYKHYSSVLCKDRSRRNLHTVHTAYRNPHRSSGAHTLQSQTTSMFRVRDEGLRSEDISYGKSKDVNFKQPIKLGRYHNFVRQHEQKIKLLMEE